MLQRLREEVLEANLELTRRGLVLYTFGNVSGISREEGLIVIKPSGVPYEEMRLEHLVVTDLGGKIVEGKLKPSSEHATAWAQARQSIPCFGTTHADSFRGPVPVTAVMTEQNIACDYEENTGHAIVRAFEHADYEAVPAILVANHGPFTWGRDPGTAAHNAVILEAVARAAYLTISINPAAQPIVSGLLEKHYLRKHGSNAYYGQPKGEK